MIQFEKIISIWEKEIYLLRRKRDQLIEFACECDCSRCFTCTCPPAFDEFHSNPALPLSVPCVYYECVNAYQICINELNAKVLRLRGKLKPPAGPLFDLISKKG